jgi:hypothetical protein
MVVCSSNNGKAYWQLINLLTRSSLLTSSGVTDTAELGRNEWIRTSGFHRNWHSYLRNALSRELGLKLLYVGFDVLTAVVMKSIIFWDISLCSTLKVNRRFGGTYRFHLQVRRISRAWNQREAGGKQSHSLQSYFCSSVYRWVSYLNESSSHLLCYMTTWNQRFYLKKKSWWF